jgi:hypothetical protein
VLIFGFPIKELQLQDEHDASIDLQHSQPYESSEPTGGERCAVVLPIRYENENFAFFSEAFGRNTVILNRNSSQEFHTVPRPSRRTESPHTVAQGKHPAITFHTEMNEKQKKESS